ncbi:hypothetical protein CSC02_1882 [Enterobacter hormaechei subsp. hoffmannii]|nr:hypothetical protein CSC02_1882 [Enterobacter hormaechei subsp. hoffmannii]
MRTLVFVIMLSGLLPKIWYDQCSHPFLILDKESEIASKKMRFFSQCGCYR